LVRRMAGTSSRRAFVFGVLACLFLAPVPLVAGPFFSSWAVGLIFGITLYGLAAVAVLLALYCLVVLNTRRTTWGLAVFVGTSLAFILPAHIVIALLALVGVASAWVIRIVPSLMATRRVPTVSSGWRRTLVVTGIALIATVVWGQMTDHGVAGSAARTTVSGFNGSWRDSVAAVAL